MSQLTTSECGRYTLVGDTYFKNVNARFCHIGDRVKLRNGRTLFIIEIDSMDNAIYGGEYAHSKTGWYINPDDIKEMEPKGQ